MDWETGCVALEMKSPGRVRGFLTVSAPLSHQGAPLPLAPSPVLLLPEVGHEDEGIYSCVATHPSHGPQESPPVSIRVAGNPSPNPGDGAGQGLR